MTTNIPPDRGQNTFDSIFLIQLLQSIKSDLDSVKGLLQSNNTTMALMIENMIGLRGEVKAWEKETAEVRAWRNDIEIRNLEAKDAEYAKDMEKIQQAQTAVQAALDAVKQGKGNSSSRMRAIAEEAIGKDKIDLRGFKISSRQFTILIIGLVLIVVMLIIFLPQSVAELLIRLGEMMGGAPPPP